MLTSLDIAALPSTPPPALAEHVSGCERCRAALLLIFVELLQAPLRSAQTTCDQCHGDLAAYMDIERAEGIAEALSAYPHIWWHLWTCADCATTYQMVRDLQDAEAEGTLSPIPLTSLRGDLDAIQARPAIRAITLPRMWFTRILAPQPGPAWGQGDDDAVIYEGEDDSYQMNVTVRRAGGLWSVIVTVDPPIEGDAVITLGTRSFRAWLRPNGVATVGPIPADLLTNPTGSAMAISIEPTEP
ncbi:MAG: hypothetical protein WCI67_09140 [Chloroflexales bacterium]